MPEEKKRRSRTNWLVLVFNGGCILALLFSYMACHFAPRALGYFALFGLAYPFIVLANLGLVVYWFFKKRRFMWFSLVAILLGWNHLTDVVQISRTRQAEEGEKTLRILTWNVHLFGLYDWKNNKQTRDAMYDVLDEHEADVLCFQEFFRSDDPRYFPTRDTLIRFLPTKYYHERYTHAINGRNYFGVALFSRHPIVGRGYIPFESDVNNFCIYADIKVGKDTVRVYNAHLQSIRFQPEDYAFVEENKNNEELKTGALRIARRLKIAFRKRQAQVEKVAESIRSCRHKVILCGDFNDPPTSYTYESFSDLLKDSFLEAGNGIGNTYIGVFPSFRIDYILHSEGMRALDYTTLPDRHSDHYPVMATLAW